MSASGVAAMVEKLIADNLVMVFSKSYCPYCAKAKNILSQFSLKSYKVVELDQREDGGAIQDHLQKLTGARSVPRVFIGGKCIGGGDDTAAKHSSGELEKMLKEVGALA